MELQKEFQLDYAKKSIIIFSMVESASYNDLLAGHTRFKSDVFGSHKQRFDYLATTQSPKVALLTCSDSRIDPGLLTQSAPGDLFTLRNAGNMAPRQGGEANSELGTLEFAVKGLGVDTIVICGHSGCGAMNAALNPESVNSFECLPHWVGQAQEAVALASETNPNPTLDQVVEANVRVQIQRLLSLRFVREAMDTRGLEVKGWFYDIGAGELREI